MIEVRNADVAKIPKNWIKVSGTKAVSRFHSPQIVKLIQEREQRKESLGIECDRAYTAFLRYFTSQMHN
jgi:DNA mismatch repair protein MSH3